MPIIDRLRIAGNQSLERFSDGTPVRDVLWAAADLLEDIGQEISQREQDADRLRKEGAESHVLDRMAEQRVLASLLRWFRERLEDNDL